MDETEKSEKTIDDAYNEALAKYAHRKDITGVDIGYKYSEGKATDVLSIRFHVKEKKAKSALESVELFPDEINSLPVDVVQGNYETVNQSSSQIETVRRTSRCSVLQPGISVAHKNGTAGTLGMLVKDERSGKPAILSNWHVLAGSRARPGDPVLQPGPYDGGRDPRDTVALLERMYLGRDGDAAIAILNNSRKFDPDITGLNITIDKSQDPELGDIVVKSGRTTGVTQGRVMGKGRYFITYHKRVGINGFIIKPKMADNPENEEISRGGDSGSIWLKQGTTTAVGLHFAGETDTRPSSEHALACFTSRIFRRLHVQPWNKTERPEIQKPDHDLSQLWKQLGAASATRIFETMDAREIRLLSDRLMKNFPQSPYAKYDLSELTNLEWDMEIGPFGAAAIGFAAGAASRIMEKQSGLGKQFSREDFFLIMASFLAGTVSGVRSVS